MLSDVKKTFFNGDRRYFERRSSQEFIGQFNLDTDDIKNLSIAALIAKMIGQSTMTKPASELELLLEMAHNSGLAGRKVVVCSTKPLGPRRMPRSSISKPDFRPRHGREIKVVTTRFETASSHGDRRSQP